MTLVGTDEIMDVRLLGNCSLNYLENKRVSCGLQKGGAGAAILKYILGNPDANEWVRRRHQ